MLARSNRGLYTGNLVISGALIKPVGRALLCLGGAVAALERVVVGGGAPRRSHGVMLTTSYDPGTGVLPDASLGYALLH